MKKFDALVVGGGPAGVTAAMYLVRSGLKTAVVEQLAHGGQLLQTDQIDNYTGFPKGIKGYELADMLIAHLNDPEYPIERISDTVVSITTQPDQSHLVKLASEEVIAKVVILACGAKYRHLNIDNETRLTGKGVSYCALCDGNFFRGQDVAVVGGGNAALEESLYLSKLVKKIYLIHRRDQFRATKAYQDKVLKAPNIEILFDSTVKSINGEKEVEGVTVENVKTGATTDLKVQGLFVFVGFEPQTGFIPVPIARDPSGFIKTDQEMRTTVPGIFAAGDIRSKSCRQIATAVGDGATAANSAFVYLETLDA